MMTSVAGELYAVRYGYTVALQASTHYTSNDVYAALLRRGARPIVAEAVIVGLVKVTKKEGTR